ncbi:MAG: VanW family protein [Clostridia bacterium]
MNNFMKKMSIIITSIMVISTFSSCSIKEENTSVNENAEITQEEKNVEKEKEKEIEKVEIVETENLQGKIGIVKASSLNVRTEPNTESKIIKSLTSGNICIMKAEMSNNWYKINVDSQDAYVSGEYVEIKNSVEMYLTKDIKVGSMLIKKGSKITVNGANEASLTCSYKDLEFKVDQSSLSVRKPQAEETKKPESAKGDLLSTFSTNYDANVKGRSTNISLASKAISVTLEKGEEFIWSEIVGQASSDKGYKEAPVFSGNNVVPGVGGGVCQVSTTLYNAVLKADLKVTERHPHSMGVSYVKPGKDAAVAYGSLDFRFVNTSGGKIQISANADNGTITVNIYKAK